MRRRRKRRRTTTTTTAAGIEWKLALRGRGLIKRRRRRPQTDVLFGMLG